MKYTKEQKIEHSRLSQMGGTLYYQAMRKKKKLSKKEMRDKKKIIALRKKVPTKYYEYIKSIYWKNRRTQYFKKFGRKCVACNSNKKIQLHHLEYDSNYFGREKDESLAVLCQPCHEEFHTSFGSNQKMYDEFNEFLELKQYRHSSPSKV